MNIIALSQNHNFDNECFKSSILCQADGIIINNYYRAMSHNHLYAIQADIH